MNSNKTEICLHKMQKKQDPGDEFIVKCIIRKARNEVRKVKSKYLKRQAPDSNP